MHRSVQKRSRTLLVATPTNWGGGWELCIIFTYSTLFFMLNKRVFILPVFNFITENKGETIYKVLKKHLSAENTSNL